MFLTRDTIKKMNKNKNMGTYAEKIRRGEEEDNKQRQL